MTKFFRIAGVVAALWLRPASGAGISFASIPANGVIDAAAGGFNGWGFDITDTTDFITLDSALFNLTSVDGVPETGGFPPIGSYTDLTLNLVGPSGGIFVVGGGVFANGTEVIQPFAPVGGTPNPGQDIGAGEVVLNPGVLAGTDVKGNIIFTYEEWSVSPNDPAFDPGADLVATNQTASVPEEVIAGVPEPGSIVLLGTALAALLLWHAVRKNPKLS